MLSIATPLMDSDRSFTECLPVPRDRHCCQRTGPWCRPRRGGCPAPTRRTGRSRTRCRGCRRRCAGSRCDTPRCSPTGPTNKCSSETRCCALTARRLRMVPKLKTRGTGISSAGKSARVVAQLGCRLESVTHQRIVRRNSYAAHVRPVACRIHDTAAHCRGAFSRNVPYLSTTQAAQPDRQTSMATPTEYHVRHMLHVRRNPQCDVLPALVKGRGSHTAPGERRQRSATALSHLASLSPLSLRARR